MCLAASILLNAFVAPAEARAALEESGGDLFGEADAALEEKLGQRFADRVKSLRKAAGVKEVSGFKGLAPGAGPRIDWRAFAFGFQPIAQGPQLQVNETKTQVSASATASKDFEGKNGTVSPDRPERRRQPFQHHG